MDGWLNVEGRRGWAGASGFDSDARAGETHARRSGDHRRVMGERAMIS